MRCPACRHELVVVEREGIEVDWCAQCHGVWFDAGEIELLAEKAGRRLDPGLIGTPSDAVGERRRRCPRCRRRMEKVSPVHEEGLLLDRCSKHGLWFDSGELGALMRGLDAGSAGGTVIGFLGETFTHSGARRGAVSSKESGT